MSQQQLAKQIFAGNSEMAMLMRVHDWSKTSLGSLEQWSQSLKTAVQIMLTSRQPMFVWWGEELINLYNEAYKAIVGGKHPDALGQPASIVWHEIWDQVGPRAESAMLNNEGTYDEALLLIMERNGYPEETYYTFSYSPIPDDQNRMGGIICANTNETQRIIGERQLALLRELAAKTAHARTFNEACTVSARCLETNPYDLPFAMIYLVEPDQQLISLAGTSGIDPNHAAVPEVVDLTSDSAWPFAKVIETHQVTIISDLGGSFDNLPMGAWQQAPHQAIAVPIASSGKDGKAGILMAGLNPFRLFDDSYRGFIELVAAQISASIANAQAYEEERKRADALAELDRAKTVFFSNVSHEFRTPLTLMLGPLEDTLSHPTGLHPSAHGQLETVHRNALRLLKLVNTLLEFSRIEAGRIQAVYEPTDLAMLTADLAGVFRSAIERAGLRLVVDCRPLSEPAYVDREMWEKIVLNLLSNAFKFTFEGEIVVVLQQQTDRVELEIRDTGTGIPADELTRIFERFHRVQGARGRTYEGSGIGLSLVQELVALHGGTIQVSSVVDHGTSFTVSIPTGAAHLPKERIGAGRTLASTAMGATPYVAEALRWLPEDLREDAESRDLEPSLDVSRQTKPLLSPTARILLADDNTDMRDYLKRLLSPQYEVTAVTDGLAALAEVRQQRPDLVLTDVMMPKLDGFGLLQELRADPQTKELPIILLSARAGEESRIEGLEAGADDYLIKPFSARELIARVEANLKLAQLRQEAAQREQAQRQEAEVATEKLEIVLSSIRDQFFVLDRDWRYTYVNRRVVETVAMTREDLLGKSIWELFPALVGSEFEQQLRRAISQQTSVHFNYLDSTWNRWFEVYAYPSSEGLTLFVTEITERKQAEAALHQNSAILNTINQSTPTLIFVKDRQGRLQMGNPALIRALGKPEFEVIGHTDIEFYLNPDDAAIIMANDRQVMETGQMQVLEETVELPEGRRIFLSTKSPYLDETGIITGLIGVSLDITERKQVEELVRRTAAIDSFRICLADALRPLADPVEIQATASRLLSEQINANRVAYFEVRGADYVVEQDYVIDSEPLIGSYPIASFGPTLLAAYRSGQTVSSCEVAADSYLSPDQKSTYAAFQIGAYIGIPLIKNGEFVAGLAIHTREPRNWTPDDIALAEETAERTWAAVERARAEVNLRQTSAKLEQQLQKFNAVMSSVPDFIYMFDLSGRFIDVNKPLLDLLQKNYVEVIGKNFLELDYPVDLAVKLQEQIQEVIRTRQPLKDETRFESAFGTGEYEYIFAPIFDPEGAVEMVAGVTRDITDLKQVEATLRESETRLKFMLDASQVGQWDLELTTKPYPAHRSLRHDQIFGYESMLPEWNYDIFLTHVHPDDRAAVDQKFQQTLSNKTDWNFECRIIYPNKSIHWIWVRSSIYCDTSSKPIRLLGLIVDITERKRAEESLQLSEERLRLATDAADIGMWFWDLLEDRLIWTTFCKQLFGLDPDTEINYQRFLEAIHPDDRDRTHAAVQQAIEHKQEYIIEYRSVWGDGSIHWILAKGRAFYNEQDEPIRMMGIAQEITDRKLAEGALQSQAHELSQMNMLLMQTTALVNQRNQELDQFAHIVSHDLKAPLRAISNLSQWIEEDLADQVPPATKQHFDLLRSRVGRMEALINGLLTYARVGYQDVPEETFSLNELLLEIVDSLAIPPKFTIQLPPNLPTITAKRLLLNQVLTNLISNAVKHHDRPDGQVKIAVQVETQAYKFAISDDGPGIAPKNHNKVFDIFQTLSSKDRKESTGIGLAIIKKIIERMDGKIHLESELGKGTTFTFTWPITQADAKH